VNREVDGQRVAGEKIKATWAGDISPALTGAAQPKPVAVSSPTITILRGFKIHSGQGKEPADPVTVKVEP
jgi:hypothetical protein